MTCEDCRFRAIYDKNPKSLLGKIWRWHINFCPGWKKYFRYLTDEKKLEVMEKYRLE